MAVNLQSVRMVAGAVSFTAPVILAARIALCGAALALLTPTARAAVVSWYGEEHRGKPMAWRGRPFNPDRLTCACWCHPFGSVLRVTSGRRAVDVMVTDRGPARWTGADHDLSRAAFARLGPLRRGHLTVTVKRLR